MIGCIRFFTIIISLTIGFAVVISIYLYAFPAITCPSFNGRLCNDRGKCSRDQCECDPMFSGADCSQTSVPGYQYVSNLECNGRGKVLPFIKRPNIPTQCFQEQPSVENGYYRNGPGYDPTNFACFDVLRTNRKAIYDGTATLAQVLGTPICICDAPWIGELCEYNGCPTQIATNLPCSGNGNVSVNYMNNFTDGVGCQCTEKLSLRSLLTLPLAEEARQALTVDFVQMLQTGVCARVVAMVNGYPIIVPSEKYQCFCDKRHYGVICNFGVCPEDPLGNTCSNFGHPGFGFGAEKNTTRAVSEFNKPCEPVCAAGTTYCRGVCVPGSKPCSSLNPRCPADKPYRCPSAECVAATPFCSRGYVYGYLDDPSRGLISVAGTTRLTSPLLYVSGYSLNATVTYLGETITESGPFLRTFNETLDQVERRVFSDWESVFVTSDGQMWPVPFYNLDGVVPAAYQVMRIVRNELVVVLDAQYSSVVVGDGDDVIANLSDTTYVMPGGRVVSLEECTDNFAACVWTTNYTSRDGTRKLCLNALGEIADAPISFNCRVPFEVPLLRGRTVAQVLPRYTDTNLYGDWMLQLFDGTAVDWVLSVDGEVRDMKIMTVDSVRARCVCPVVATNQSTLNEKWYNSVNRLPSTSGNVVAKSLAYGDVRYVRGILASPTTVATATGLVEIFGDAKHITDRELRLGTPSCVDDVTPFRCADFSCASLKSYVYPNATVECSCLMSKGRTAECVCNDGISTQTCTCGLRECTCFEDYEFQLFLFNEIQSYGVNQSCFIVQPFGPWEFPIQLEAQGCTNQTFELEGLLLGRWQIATYDSICDAENNTLIIPQQYETPYEDFRIVNDSRPLTLEFIPWGVSAYLVNSDYEVSASSNEEDAINAIVDDFTYWESEPFEHSFLRVDFDRPMHFIGVFIVFRTLGFEIPGYGNFTARAEIQGGSRQSSNRASWKFLNDTASDLIDQQFSVFVGLDYYGESLRVFSAFPMAIRRFIPLVDQNCDLGEIKVTPTSEYPVVRDNIFDTRTDPNCSCVCVDDCTVAGVRLDRNGVCEDYRYITRDITPVTVNVLEGNLTADQFMLNLTDSLYFFPNYSGYHIWSTVSTPPDITNFTANQEAVFSTDIYSYIAVGPLVFATNTTLLIYTEDIFVGGYLEGFNTCNNGFDCFDCGNNCRFQTLDPDLQCGLSPYDARMQEYYENSSIVEFNYLLETDELLDRNFQLNFSLVLNRTATRLGRGSCDDCDGRFRCTDGRCVDFERQCEVSRYDCPGDGCVQPDVNRREFKCACAKTHNGLDCSFTRCTPLDTLTGLVDPHRVCSCSDSPPLKIKPPFSEVKRRTPYNSRDVLVLNRRNPRQGLEDVGWINVQADFAPYGYAFYRTYYEGGVLQYTNCPYVVRDPLGVMRTLEECVAERSPVWPHPVTRWRDFQLVNGSTVQFPWDGPYYEVKYDMAPHRCTGPKYFGCVATAKDCFNEAAKNPACGDSGECLVDGICQCEPERETWVLNPTITEIARVPYYTIDGVTNPIQWGKPNPTQYSAFQCLSRNCSVVDCGPPVSCYAGDPLLRLGDKLIPCGVPSNHYGWCGRDLDACNRGDVVPPVTCSGNGILRKVDYREEWYCACGTPKSNLVNSIDDIKTITELTPNGFGGFACSQYYCTDQTGVYFSRKRKEDGGSYIDADGLPLPGRWIGSCGAPAGPSPEDLPQWHSCCPGIKRLEKCEKVLCDVGALGSSKTTQCLAIEDCQGQERKPRIYNCNNHGSATADGRCDCDRDETRGTGYTYDYSVFAYQGCFRPIRCALALDGSVCNQKEQCGQFEWWSEFPPIKYADNQLLVLAQRAGLPMTNETLVNLLAEGLNDYTYNVLLISMEQLALGVQRAIQQLQTTICVLSANESAADPPGMVPYVGRESIVGPYMKSYNVPHLINYNSSYPLLRDRFFTVRTDLANFVEGQEYLILNRTFNASQQIVMNFTDSYHISAIRVHAWYTQSNPPAALLEFMGDSGFVCNDLAIPNTPTMQWHGPNLAIYCVPTYTSYSFRRNNPTDFLTQCQRDETSDQCIEWKDATCLTVGGIVNPPANYTNLYIGCDGGRCCIPDRADTFLPTRSLTISMQYTQYSNNLTVYIDEIQVYGYADSVLPTPQGLKDYLWFKGEPNVSCVDERYMHLLLGSDNGYYQYVNLSGITNVQLEPEPATNMTYDIASVNCQDRGGFLATSRGAEDQQNYALFTGTACPRGNCLVDAKNRLEILTPEPVDFMFEWCLVYGCWTPEFPVERSTYDAASRVYVWHYDFVSTPGEDDGLQWQLPWNTFQQSWPDVVYTQMVASIWQTSSLYEFVTGTQVNYSPYLGVTPYFPRYPYVSILTAQPNCPFCNLPPYNCPVQFPGAMENYCCEYNQGGVNYGYTCAYPNQVRTTAPPVLTTPFALPSKSSVMATYQQDMKFTYWTNPQSCVLSIYSEAGCGMMQKDRKSGCVYRRVISPKDDYADAGRWLDVTQATFNECVDPAEGCSCLGQRLGFYFYSFVVSGPCQAIISGFYVSSDTNRQLYNYLVNPGLQNYASPSDYNTRLGIQSSVTARPEAIGNGYNWNFRWVAGCYSQYCDTYGYWEDRRAGPQPDAPYGFPQDYLRYERGHLPKCRYRSAGTLNRLYIIPTFRTRKVTVHFTSRSSSAGVPPYNDNAYYLTYFKHIYMCMNVEVHVTKEVLDKLDGSRNVDYWERYESVAWGPSQLTYNLGFGNVVINTNVVTEAAPDGQPVNDLLWNSFSNIQTFPRYGLFVPVKKCDGNDLPRQVAKCISCIKEQPPGEWQWDQQFVNSRDPVFKSELLYMRQTTINPPPPVRPVLYFQFWSALGNRTITKLVDLQYEVPPAFARIISNIQSDDYKRLLLTNNQQPGYFLDNCVRVVFNPQNQVQYAYDTAVCELPQYKALCIYDFQKYVVQPGRQCDQCGPSSCQRNLCKGETAFTLYPLANAELFPYQHALYQAMLDGSLNTFAETQPTDYNAIMEYIYSLNQSLVFAFPEARQMLYAGQSDRPGRVSRGQVANPSAWVDMDYKTWYPFTCPPQFSRATGLSYQVCAASAEYCDPESTNQFSGPDMAEEDIPTIFKAFSGDVTREKSCGVQVVVARFFTRDSDGGPAPQSNNYAVLESTQDYVIFKFFRTSGDIRNTGKMQHYIFADNATITGNVECALACTVEIWISTRSPVYGDPVSIKSVGNTTGGDYSFVVENLNSSYVYQIVGFTVLSINVSSTIKLTNPLITDAASIVSCTTPRGPKMVETSSFTYSAHPLHRCIYTPDEAVRYETKTVGVCQAADSSPWGGPTNEFPTVVSYRGKNICNVFGDADSLYYTSDGSKVPINADGVYQYSAEVYQCKCRWDIGTIISTKLRLASTYDFAYILRSDNLPNVALYVSFSGETVIDDYGIGWPSTFADSEQACEASSDTLVSFINTEEFSLYLNQFVASTSLFFGVNPRVFMDIGWDRDDNLNWEERGEVIEYCALGVDGQCGAAIVGEICDNADLCSAYNFNNYVYQMAGNVSAAFMTDGKNISSSFPASLITITLTQVLSEGITVSIWSDADLTLSPFTVFTNGTVDSCSGPVNEIPSLYEYTCDNRTVGAIQIQRSAGSLPMREVQVFELLDTTRTYGIFQNV